MCKVESQLDRHTDRPESKLELITTQDPPLCLPSPLASRLAPLSGAGIPDVIGGALK